MELKESKTLDYEERAARPPKRWWLIATAALTLGIAIQICSSKFTPPLRRHFEMLDVQKRVLSSTLPTTVGIDRHGSPIDDTSPQATQAASRFLFASGGMAIPAPTQLAWAGILSCRSDRERLVLLFVDPWDASTAILSPDDDPISGPLHLMGYTFSPASVLTDARRLTWGDRLEIKTDAPATIGPISRISGRTSQLRVIASNARASLVYRLTLNADDSLTLEPDPDAKTP